MKCCRVIRNFFYFSANQPTKFYPVVVPLLVGAWEGYPVKQSNCNPVDKLFHNLYGLVNLKKVTFVKLKIKTMSILQIVIGIILLVLGFWANNTYIAPGILRIIINIVLVLIVIFLILSVFGFGNLGSVRV